MTRQDVYNLINQEREYQDSKWAALDDDNTVGDFLVYMKRYLDNAIRDYVGSPDLDALDSIRKVAALGVAAMECHGAPARSAKVGN